jgi:membrane protease YdiL (CAAX protease family)
VAQESGGVSIEAQVSKMQSARHSLGLPFLLISVAVPTTLIVMGEIFFYLKNFEMPLAFHGFNILFCILAPFLLNLPPQIFQAFSLVSLLRILNIGMPVFFDMTIYWLPFIYAPILLVGFMIASTEFANGSHTLGGILSLAVRKMREANPTTISLYLAVALGLGAVLGYIEYQILQPERLIPDLTIGSLVLLGVVMFLFVGLGEELVFRYLLQDRLKTVLGVTFAVILASVIFAIMHSGYSNPVYLIYVLFIGFIFGISYEKTRSLLFVTLLHGAINFFLFSVFPS